MHFYWVVAHKDVKAFEWFVHLIADLQYELYRGREAGAVAPRNYCEINVYVTRAPKDAEIEPLRSKSAVDAKGALPRVFTADQLHRRRRRSLLSRLRGIDLGVSASRPAAAPRSAP